MLCVKTNFKLSDLSLKAKEFHEMGLCNSNFTLYEEYKVQISFSFQTYLQANEKTIDYYRVVTNDIQ